MKQALLFAAIGVIAVSACGGVDQQQQADLPSAPGLQAAAPAANSCEWKVASNLAKDYFSIMDDYKLAKGYLGAAENAAYTSVDRNNNLFEVFKLVASARDSNHVKAGGQTAGGELIALLVTDEQVDQSFSIGRNQ